MSGKVVDDKEAGIRLEMGNGSARVPKSEIEWIVLGTDEEIENARLAAGHFEQAQEYFKKRKYDSAVLEYKKAIEREPNDANLFNNMGCAYAYLEMHPEAITAFANALRHKKNNLTVILNLSQVYIKVKDFRRAERCLRKLTVLTHSEPDAYTLLGIVFYKLRRYTKSIDAYRKALSLAGSVLPSTDQDGSKSMESMKLDLQPSLKKDPKRGMADIYNNMGSSYLGLGRVNEAKEAYEKAIELNPEILSAKYNLEVVGKKQEKIIASVSNQ